MIGHGAFGSCTVKCRQDLTFVLRQTQETNPGQSVYFLPVLSVTFRQLTALVSNAYHEL